MDGVRDKIFSSLQLDFQSFPILQLTAKKDTINTVIGHVWENKVPTNTLSPTALPLFDIYNSNYSSAISGLDEVKANMLKNNMAKLAACKTTKVMQALDSARTNTTDKAVFLDKAKTITNKFNSYQVAEYNTAVHRTRITKQWEQFQGEKELYPNVEWLHTRSATPREIHLQYVGRVWPMDSEFWANNHPGCVYNCKCSWKTTDRPSTENDSLKEITPSPGLEGNPYYTDEIISDKHPYYQDTDKHVPSLGPLYNPDDVAYIKQTTPDGDAYFAHYNCLSEPETKGNTKIVNTLLKHNVVNDIKLLPIINSKQVALRERYYGKEYQKTHPTECPDALADGIPIEFKTTDSVHLSNNVLKASKKADVVAVNCTDNPSPDHIERFAKWQFTLNDRKNLKKLIIISKGKVHVFVK